MSAPGGEMSEMFVVLGEIGEYSDRCVSVCAVFTSKARAIDAIIKASARRREYISWYESLCALQRSRRPRPIFLPSVTTMAEYNAPDRPPHEGRERFLLVTVPTDIWNGDGFDELEQVGAPAPGK